MAQTVKAHDLNFELFINEQTIQKTVADIGEKITQDYQNKKPLLLGILNGSFVFAADLMRTLEIDAEIEFVKLTSYEGLNSSGILREMIGLEESKIENRHLIIIEDIIDTGNTLARFLPELEKMNPASIALATFLLKPEALQHPLKISYLGIKIPNKFVIGYGLDYNGLGRGLRGIYQII